MRNDTVEKGEKAEGRMGGNKDEERKSRLWRRLRKCRLEINETQEGEGSTKQKSKKKKKKKKKVEFEEEARVDQEP